ncbi:DUF535 family protein [Variovorax terrae]|uniref:VirK/YbjX family protein n=1 Tax=Variovorax terrae TaxID=2923278 RepID=A0A9X1VYU7_9BURK|nr:DUF535 family protein [Variovorax terrae]MCJ0764684.1 VirK/YbjX family protein [Variovorax terrae]
MNPADAAATDSKPPGLGRSLSWAWQAPPAGGVSRLNLTWRLLKAQLRSNLALRRWMAVVHEHHERGLMPDLPAEFLRAVRPDVNRGVSLPQRITHLIDHADWLETAFQPAALQQLAAGQPVVLAELPSSGHDPLRLQLQRAAPHSLEGDLLLTLTTLPDDGRAVDLAALAFSCFRIQGQPCLAIGGLRGPRQPGGRLSPEDLLRALRGWRTPVFLVRVMQSLAQFWNLPLVGLDPAWHSLQAGGRLPRDAGRRELAQRIADSHNALWEHFGAKHGAEGWRVLSRESDDALAATASSADKRARQARRADYWIRVNTRLSRGLGEVLLRPGRHASLHGMTESHTIQDNPFTRSGAPSSVLDSGPGELIGRL